MHFLHPEKFPLAGEFDLNGSSRRPSFQTITLLMELWTCYADEENESKIRDLHGKLESIMLRRLKRDVIKELPTKSERILRVEMSNMQVRTLTFRSLLVTLLFISLFAFPDLVV